MTPRARWMLEERLDVQRPFLTTHSTISWRPSIRRSSGAVNVPQTEAEDQWSNAEFDDPAADRRGCAGDVSGEAPELVGVA